MSETRDQVLPDRPAHCGYSSISDLYQQFERIFLGNGGCLQSGCGHNILVFDHHFFHLAAIRTAAEHRLFMRDEKNTIRETVDGFGKYLIEHGGARARNLPSAKMTIVDPDEVWEENPRAKSATWVYIKEFNSSPYPFTVAFLTIRPEEGNIIVPVSSFPCKKSDSRKWRAEKCVYQKHARPA